MSYPDRSTIKLGGGKYITLLAGLDAGAQISLDPPEDASGEKEGAGVFTVIPLQLSYGAHLNLMASPADFRVDTDGLWSYRPRLGVGLGEEFPIINAYGLAEFGLGNDKMAFGGGLDLITTTVLFFPGFFGEVQKDINSGETSLITGVRWAHALPYHWLIGLFSKGE